MAAVFTERASSQLEAIITYIARSSPRNARSALERIETPFRCSAYREGARGGVQIIVVAHGHQLLEALLEEDAM
jgi:plasmid stabilization system protein ParE